MEEVPDSDVCSQSGTMLWKWGLPTGLIWEDYENAVTENTAAFLESDTSNYQITGFTHEARACGNLAKQHITVEFPFWWILAEALWMLPFMESSLKRPYRSF